MARYAKIDVRIWGDARFKWLSPLPPSGQSLWLYLLAPMERTGIPGVIVAGEAGMAESLGWTTEAFREAFGEVYREGLAEASWKDRIIWLPRATKYNSPESPNVVRGWKTRWDEIAECELKLKIWRHLKAFAEGLGEGFARAFREACPQPFGKPLAKTMPNHEHEHEHEHEKRITIDHVPVSEVGSNNSEIPDLEPEAEKPSVASLPPPEAQDAPGEQEAKAEKQNIAIDQLISIWNKICVPAGFAKALRTAKQRKDAATRMREPGWIDHFRAACLYAVSEPFYRGGGDRSWVMTFGWLLHPGNAEKLAERAATTAVRANGNGAQQKTVHWRLNKITDELEEYDPALALGS